MRTITAKFNSYCSETGQWIKKGEKCLYDPTERKVYGINSQRYKDYQSQPDEAACMIQDQENAYFDNFCYANNI